MYLEIAGSPNHSSRGVLGSSLIMTYLKNLIERGIWVLIRSREIIIIKDKREMLRNNTSVKGSINMRMQAGTKVPSLPP